MSFPTSGTAHGIAIAFDDDALEPNPTWTRIDDGGLVQSWSIERGRSSELDKTGTGTASVKIRDTNGTFDPTLSIGPFFNKLDPLKQAAIALYNPVTTTYSTIFRGFVNEWSYELDQSARFMDITLDLVDGFDVFAALRMVPGVHGAGTAVTGEGGDIVFEGEPSVPKHVDTRIQDALDNVGWPSALTDLFSGNVTVIRKIYQRGDSILTVIQDAADAEFPGVANAYMSKAGIFRFRGRYARFFPENPGYGINTWLVGFQAQAAANPSIVPVAGFQFRRSANDIINSVVTTAFEMPDIYIPDVTSSGSTSIATFGYRGETFDDLVLYQGHDDDENPVTTIDELKKMSDYYQQNFEDPRTRVTTLRFRPRAAGQANATALWAFLCGVEIGDIITLTSSHPGSGGFEEEDFYVEGIHYDADTEGGAAFTNVTLELDVSPRSYYGDNPFGTVDDGV